jgi:mono/diheme cytochrome c family protein
MKIPDAISGIKFRRLRVLAMLWLAGCAPAVAHAGADNVHTDPSTIAAGKYLAAAGDCAACHTAPGGKPFAGGVVINTPFGKLLGSNITPDPATGIGGWTDKQFVAALKYGVGHNVGPLYPGMPYIYFNHVSVSDIIKIHAYLESLPPVSHRVISNQLPFPFDIRMSMRAWDLLFFPKTGDYHDDASQSAQWNRGAYLVQGLGHCAACHTSKNFLGGDHTGKELQGAVIDNANAPDLLNDPHNGLSGWSVTDVGAYLKNGHNRFAGAAGPMAEVVTLSTSQLTVADDTAIAVYLKSLPPSAGPAPIPISGNDPAVVQAPVPVTMLNLIVHGGQNVGTQAAHAAAMPAFALELDKQQIADVSTYIRNSWSNAAPAVPVSDVPSP